MNCNLPYAQLIHVGSYTFENASLSCNRQQNLLHVFKFLGPGLLWPRTRPHNTHYVRTLWTVRRQQHGMNQSQVRGEAEIQQSEKGIASWVKKRKCNTIMCKPDCHPSQVS